MKALLGLLVAIALTSCAGTQYRAEYEHVSHPTTNREDTLDHVNVCGQRRHGRLYADACLGYRLIDDGFFGPDLTGSVRVGVLLNEATGEIP